jgi:hypothetical protein
MWRGGLAKIRTYRELPKTLGVGCNKWRRNELWIVMADSGELMLILDSKNQVSYIPTFFLSRKSRMEHMYTNAKK